MSQLQVTGEAKIRDLQGPVVANDGVITALDGAASQYVRGDGTLADFPTSSGGGSSVSYYLNSSVSQGTIGGVAYRELSKDPIIGTGTDIAISSNGYVANYITDVNDPDVIIVPGGNFNCEFYFSVNNNTGNPTTYAELYKYDGTTFTLLGSSVGVPESINQGTTIAPYYFAIPVATATLALTDRLAIRIYVNVDGRTVTLHTENGHLCQVVTTLSKGILSINNLTDQSQNLTTGTSGTNFAIVSSGDTHTFNLPVASATNTGKLSSTDWSTFNNKQNALTNPITGIGASGNVAYFNGTTSITAENSFNYDASTNRLGVNTTVPNATIGANAGTDSGYSLLLKNDNANYNGIGFATDSTYGNLISTEKLGTALSRNLTLLNQSGYISLTEAGNLGVGLLTPNTGLDIYNGSNAYLWLHTATSGITGTDGVRLALFSTNGANLRNFDGSFSITAEGDFSIITIGAENFRVNSVDGSIYQSKVANAMLKSVSGVITAAVAGTDYVVPSALSGYVPTSRTITINGTTQNLSTDITYTVGTMGGSGTSGQVAYFNGTNSITSEGGFIYDSSTNRLGVNTSVPNATIGADSALDSGYGLLIKTGASNYNGIGIAIDSTYGNLISTEKLGTASARNLTLLNQSGFVSLRENGNFGVNTLNPAVSGTGIDIYGSTSTGLRFHTATSGTTVTDGAGINFSAANNLGITNYEAGAIDIVTNGNSGVYIASNGYVGINGASGSYPLEVNGGIRQTSVTSALVKTDSVGLLVAAVAGTDYVAPSALSGYVPTSRTITINGTSQNLSTDISYSVGTLTGNGSSGRIPFYTGSQTFGNSANFIWDDTNGYLGVNNTPQIPLDVLGAGFNVSGTTMNIVARFLKDKSATFNGIGLGYDTSSRTGIIYADTASGPSNIAFWTYNTSYAERMRITGAGNVGIGTSSPSAALHISGSGYASSRIYLQRTSGAIGTYSMGVQAADNCFGIVDEAQGNLTRIFINGSGNVGIGTSSPTGQASDNRVLQIYGAGTANRAQIHFTNVNTGEGTTDGTFLGIDSGSDFYIVNREAAATVFENNGGERMRITSGGNVFINATSGGNERFNVTQSGAQWAMALNHTNSTQFFVDFRNNGTQTGSIIASGGVTSYNVTSDYRLKQDFKQFNGLELISKINTYDFEFKQSKLRMYGVIAHELQEVVPYAVSGEKDGEMMQGVDYSKLTPINTKAIQELYELVKEQQAQIEELKELIKNK